MIDAMKIRHLLIVSLGLAIAVAFAEEVKLPVDHDDKGTVYVAPNLSPTEKSVDMNGASVGVQRPDGQAVYGGVDTSSPLPTYSAGVSTGGNVSFSAGASSDGKASSSVKAGVTIKY